MMPLNVAVDIGRLVAEARADRKPIDVTACASELFLRHLASGCSREEIAEALQDEAEDAGVTRH